MSLRNYQAIAACRRAAELLDALAEARERDDDRIDDAMSAVALQHHED